MGRSTTTALAAGSPQGGHSSPAPADDSGLRIGAAPRRRSSRRSSTFRPRAGADFLRQAKELQKREAEAEAQAQAESQAEGQGQAEAQAQAESQAEGQGQAEAQAQAEGQAKPVTAHGRLRNSYSVVVMENPFNGSYLEALEDITALASEGRLDSNSSHFLDKALAEQLSTLQQRFGTLDEGKKLSAAASTCANAIYYASLKGRFRIHMRFYTASNCNKNYIHLRYEGRLPEGFEPTQDERDNKFGVGYFYGSQD